MSKPTAGAHNQRRPSFFQKLILKAAPSPTETSDALPRYATFRCKKLPALQVGTEPHSGHRSGANVIPACQWCLSLRKALRVGLLLALIVNAHHRTPRSES